MDARSVADFVAREQGEGDHVVDERLEQARRRLRVDPSDDEIAAWLMEQRRVGRPYRFGHVETLAPSMWRACEAARVLLASSRPLLILGEAGSGRTRLARSVHDLGPRSAGPWFASEACSSMNPSRLELELLGYVKRGLGGQVSERGGLFAVAGGGTLLLRDIDDVGDSVARILGRAVARGAFTQVGGQASVPFDVRVVMTSSTLCFGFGDLCDVVRVPALGSRPQDGLPPES